MSGAQIHGGIDPAALIREIRLSIGMIALLHEGDHLDAASMRAAHKIINEELDALAAALRCARDLPIMTLGEVAARAKSRADGGRPHLQLVEGGAA